MFIPGTCPAQHALPDPDDDVVWPEEDWPDWPEHGQTTRHPRRTGNDYIGRHRLIEADVYDVPRTIDLLLAPSFPLCGMAV